jgi:hypothetical protein
MAWFAHECRQPLNSDGTALKSIPEPVAFYVILRYLNWQSAESTNVRVPFEMANL